MGATQGTAYGVNSSGYGYGASNAYGIRGYAYSKSSGDAYGGYFYTSSSGEGVHYGVFASSDDYSGWFQNGPVHVGDAGVQDYATADGDLYVENKGRRQGQRGAFQGKRLEAGEGEERKT